MLNFIRFSLPLICVSLSFFLSFKIIVHLFRFFSSLLILSSISVCLVSSPPFLLLLSLFRYLLNISLFVSCEVSICCAHFSYFAPLTPLLPVPLRSCDLPFTKPEIQTNSHFKCCYSICFTYLSTGGTYVADDKCRSKSRVVLTVAT